jgi:hypothetical protein
MMKIFEATISSQVVDFFNENLNGIASFKAVNQNLYERFGLVTFFDNQEEFDLLKEMLLVNYAVIEEPDRAAYGDFQTNAELANKAVSHLTSKGISPEVIIEPTCGKGSFIIAALSKFNSIKHLIGVEIYKPYVWETKFSIIDFFLSNPCIHRPEISIIHCDVFQFDFKSVSKKYSSFDILIIGNPPWVTNSKLGTLNSINLPKKSNFKNHSGLDAMTGKGNFDIAEYITLTMIRTFQHAKGSLLLLVKSSVIRNIVFEQNKNHFHISPLEKYVIDSKKEFDVSVDAALFYCQLNNTLSYECAEFDFYHQQSPQLTFGWVNNKFVSNIENYSFNNHVDGECPFVWRQGLKHDCSSVMELEKVESSPSFGTGLFVNGLNQEVILEDDLVYGLLKSADLKNKVVDKTRKFTIVTQNKVGQETNYINNLYPQTHQYLTQHQVLFNARKSSIYRNKPPFSIFGIGDYSFKPFKVAISGLYKSVHFTLVLPQNNKSVMLDDTCYFLGFDHIEFAVYTLFLLNSDTTVQFLRSITFSDAKRTFTKDVLMRIDLLKLANQVEKDDLQAQLDSFNKQYEFELKLDLWHQFLNEMTPITNRQLSMFA